MPRKIDLQKMKKKSVEDLRDAIIRLDTAKNLDYLLVWWMSAMTAVEIHGRWERYVEKRLVASLNHSPKQRSQGGWE